VSRKAQAWQLLALGSLALAQPLFELIGRQPEFLAVRHLDALDVVLFMALAMGLPCAVVLVLTWAVSLVGQLAARRLHGLAVLVLAALIVLPLLPRLGLSSSWLASLTALALGTIWARFTAAPAAGEKSGPAGWPTVSVLVVLVVAGLFLGQPSIRSLLFGGSVPSSVATLGEDGALPDLVMVIFDELGTADLLAEDGSVDGETFPNFARLARQSHWYPGHQTVADGTTHAVPAILTGRRISKPEALPTLSDHPVNLFTLLAPSYRLAVHESATSLAPQQTATTGERAARLAALALDSSVLWVRSVLPAEWLAGLPEVTSKWSGFVALSGEAAGEGWLADVAHELGGDRRALFDDLLAGLAPGAPPTVHYLHVLLPHTPLEYLPDGADYTVPVKGMDDKVWSLDQAGVELAWQRHLLQLAFADQQLGRVLDRLQASGLYDESLIVVTADHGACFAVGQRPRAVTPGNRGEILPVPLFIKRPGQERGEVHQGFAETIDILPTLWELLGRGTLTGEGLGQSLVSGARAAPAERTVMSFVDGGTERRVPGVVDGLVAAAARRRAMFPRPGQSGLFAVGPRRELLDRKRDALPLAEPTTSATVIDAGQLQQSFSRQDTPRVVQGRWLGESAVDLVLAVNGTIRATTRGLAADSAGLQHFMLFVPESALVDEGNRLSLFVVEDAAQGVGAMPGAGITPGAVADPAADCVLRPVAPGPGAYELRAEGERHWLVDSRGQVVPVVADALRGRFQVRVPVAGDVAVTGWAYDARQKRPVKAVVVFADDRFLFAVTADADSPSLIEKFGQGAAHAGYRVVLREERLGGATLSAVRVFAVSARGEAAELGGTY